MTSVFAFIEGGLSIFHWAILLIVGVLLFGKRLPEVGRALGKGIIEFKKGLKGLEDETDSVASTRPDPSAPALQPPPRPPQRVAPSAPKFEDNAGTITTNPPTA